MGFIWVDDKEDDEKFVAHINKVTKSLTDSKEGLQADITRLKKQLKDYEGVDLEEVTRLKAKIKELEEKRDETETDLQKQIRLMREQNENETKELKATVELLNNSNKKLLVDDEINKGLIEFKVKPAMLKAARRIIKADVVVVDEDGKRVAKVGDKTIAEHIADWAKTEEGKNFVLANVNGGGDSKGNDKDTIVESEQEKFFDKKSKSFNYTKQVQLKKTDRKMYDKLVNKFKN